MNRYAAYFIMRTTAVANVHLLDFSTQLFCFTCAVRMVNRTTFQHYKFIDDNLYGFGMIDLIKSQFDDTNYILHIISETKPKKKLLK